MRKTLAILLACLLPAGLLAQVPAVLNESFDNNDRKWPIGIQDGYEASISGGQLQFKRKREGSYFFPYSAFLDPSQDYVVGVTITIASDPDGNRFHGLVWGSSGGESNYFLITRSRTFSVIRFQRGERVAEVESQTSKHLTPDGPNSIAVVKKGNKILYFINGQIVHQSFQTKIYGNGHGFLLGGLQARVDNFVIRQEPSPIQLVDKPRNGYTKENIGAGANSYASEICPIVSPDGQTLYVCRARHAGNIGGIDDQDAWVSERLPDSTWGAIRNMGLPLNDGQQNAVTAVSADQNTLFLNYDGRDDPGLLRTVRTETGWSKPERVLIDNFYNHDHDAEFSLAPSGKVMVYSVDRDDTFGGKDLYVSFRRPDGSWTAPKNLGPTINTFSVDFAPFLAADGRTLYFASMGHPGYGSADIFVSKRLDDTWTNWSPPKNLGPEINTAGWDAYYTITASGEEAYLVGQGQYGETDVFRIDMKQDDKVAKPDPVVLVKGKVFDRRTGKPMGGTIIYENLATGEEVGIARSDPRTGAYQIALPYGLDYGFLAKAPQHISVSEHLDLSKLGEYRELKRDLYLEPLEAGATVKLQNVFFLTASDQLLPTSYSELERVAELLKENPSLRILVKGHTDSLGPPDRLQRLSEARALAVRKFLVEKGIAETRIEYKGLGGTEPVAPNDTPENQQLNRRVEFVVLP